MLRSFITSILLFVINFSVSARYYGYTRGGRDTRHYPTYVWIIALLLPFILLASVSLYHYCKAYEYKLFKLFLYFDPLSEGRQQILKEKFPYYKVLNQNARREFRKRVNHFLINKKFVSTDEIEITEEMKVMIAATSIQILFGRESYYLSSFNTINITAKDVTNLNTFRETKQIEICWETFSAGYSSITDGYNPGLKIMAMALSLEYQFSQKGIFNRHTFKTFDKLYKQQAEKYIQSGKSKYNDYDQVDRDLYFAVAVEYFFERPEHFHANQPAMYLALSKLLRQDPLGMYKYEAKFF
ncbi:zinc-dependent peptidase [Cytophaga aurantiaca]|uniref:zinc-dependent peptidase n=1 Tax=Cytophaga aurantiaca TaxID=29530 RepID=UPI0003AAAF83|nr:zinc-dependent peptidase [Cytophaga aurantiaca]